MLAQSVLDRMAELGGLSPARGTTFAPLREDHFQAIQARFGSSIPDDYRSFISIYGGGAFSQSVRYVRDQSLAINPGYFYGDGPDETSVFHIQWAIQVYNGRVPSNLMPIVDCRAAGLICLCMADPDKGRVYFWDRHDEWASELEECIRQGVPAPPDLQYRNLTALADTFSGFILGLEPDAD